MTRCAGGSAAISSEPASVDVLELADVDTSSVLIAIPAAVAIAVASALGYWLKSRAAKRNDSWTPPKR